jgi:hypothetical protein
VRAGIVTIDQFRERSATAAELRDTSEPRSQIVFALALPRDFALRVRALALLLLALSRLRRTKPSVRAEDGRKLITRAWVRCWCSRASHYS